MTGDSDFGREIRSENEVGAEIDHMRRRGSIHDRSGADYQFRESLSGHLDQVSQHLDGPIAPVRELEGRQATSARATSTTTSTSEWWNTGITPSREIVSRTSVFMCVAN